MRRVSPRLLLAYSVVLLFIGVTVSSCSPIPSIAPHAVALAAEEEPITASNAPKSVNYFPPIAATPVVQQAPTPTPLPIPTAIPPSPTPTLRPLRDRFDTQPGDTVTEVTPGVIHIQRTTADPLRINILLFDITSPRFDLRVGLYDGWLAGRARTSSIARIHEAFAAVNGDLFDSNGIPQGLTIVDGTVAMAPKYRATFGWTYEREPVIGYFTSEWTWQADLIAPDGARHPVTLLNSRCPPDQICLFNHMARVAPERGGDTKVMLDTRYRVQRIIHGGAVSIDETALVVQGTGLGGAWLRKHVAKGDRIALLIRTSDDLDRYRQAISGGPIILRNGEFVQDCLCALRDCSQTETPKDKLVCEDFSTDWKMHHYLWVRMPRTGIGYDRAKETLIVAVVDGYQRGYSRGITQEEFADLLREFGADSAMELDGGGSSTMVLQGQVVNRPPDDTGERHVANALLFYWYTPED